VLPKASLDDTITKSFFEREMGLSLKKYLQAFTT